MSATMPCSRFTFLAQLLLINNIQRNPRKLGIGDLVMKNQKKKKLLMALDGSEQALNAARYVSEFTPFHKMKVVLFNVFKRYGWLLKGRLIKS